MNWLRWRDKVMTTLLEGKRGFLQIRTALLLGQGSLRLLPPFGGKLSLSMLFKLSLSMLFNTACMATQPMAAVTLNPTDGTVTGNRAGAASQSHSKIHNFKVHLQRFFFSLFPLLLGLWERKATACFPNKSSQPRLFDTFWKMINIHLKCLALSVKPDALLDM